MNNTGKKKVYALVLGLGVIALAVDKLALTDSGAGPQAAYAAGNQTRPSPPASDQSAVADGAATPIPELPFPRSLPPFDPAMDRRDLFAIPKSIRERLKPAEPKNAPGADIGTKRGPSGAEGFESRHRVSAVLSFGGESMAVVDDVRMRVGDILDDCELVEIMVADRSVVFRCDNKKAILTTAPITEGKSESHDRP